MINKKVIFSFIFSVLLLTILFSSGESIYAVENLEKTHDTFLLKNGLSIEDLELMDSAMKELIVKDIEEDLKNNKEIELNYSESEVKEYYFDENNTLIEIPPKGDISILSTIPAADLKLHFATANRGQRVQRIFAHFEWTKKSTAPREFIGFSKESSLDIIPNTYEARIVSRSQSYYDWQYYGDASGRPYQINSNHGASWMWRGNSAFYKGHVSYRVDTQNRKSGIFQMQYASDPQASNTTVSVQFGILSINHSLSGNRSMMKAPHRATVIFR